MKRFLKPLYLPPVVLALAIITYILRTFLWAEGIGGDDRFLPVGTWPDVLSWIMVALAVAISALGIWSLRKKNDYAYHFPRSNLAAIGMILAGLSFCITGFVDLYAGVDRFGIMAAVLGFPAGAALWLLAYGRIKGRRFPLLFHGLVCMYLMFHLVSHYRLWSSYPQLQMYAFELLAIVFVMLACYHRAAFDADQGNCRAYTFFTLMALFFCVATLPGCDNPAFFLGCGAWMYFTPCRLHQPSRKED